MTAETSEKRGFAREWPWLAGSMIAGGLFMAGNLIWSMSPAFSVADLGLQAILLFYVAGALLIGPILYGLSWLVRLGVRALKKRR